MPSGITTGLPNAGVNHSGWPVMYMFLELRHMGSQAYRPIALQFPSDNTVLHLARPATTSLVSRLSQGLA